METLTCILLGLGLSAACGFRVFVPLLGMNLAHLSGHMELAQGFEWLGTVPATVAFGTATVLETGAFYIPWLNHFLDTVAAPAAWLAGTVVAASQLGEVSPFLKWTLAAIAGGGVSAAVHAGTALIRVASTATTAGLGSFAVATGEGAASVFLTVTAIFLPFVGVLVLLVLVWGAYRMVRLLRSRRQNAA